MFTMSSRQQVLLCRQVPSVTLTVSQGLIMAIMFRFQCCRELTKDDALTTLGKFIDIQITEQQSTEVAEGTVIAQDPEAYAADLGSADQYYQLR